MVYSCNRYLYCSCELTLAWRRARSYGSGVQVWTAVSALGNYTLQGQVAFAS